MADSIVCMAAERMRGLIEEQARHHVNPVRGAEEMLLGLIVKLQTSRNVIDDAEKRRSNKDVNIAEWLSKLEWTAYELDYVLDEWSSAIRKLQISDVLAPPKQKVCSFIPSSSRLLFKKVVVRSEIVDKLLNVRDQLDVVLKEKDRYGFVISQPTVGPWPKYWRDQSTPLVDLDEVVHGRDVDREIIVGKLVNNGGSQVVCIVGMGGFGKTTLARLVCNHSQVTEYFELRIWVHVSDPFDLTAIAKGILEDINRTSPNSNNLEVLLRMVQESVNGKRFLLVLDNVWTEDHKEWEPLINSLRFGRAGSRVLVTTRNIMVVEMLGSRDESGMYHLGLLSDDDCWLLLCRIALSERKDVEFEEIGKVIGEKCYGLPIAAKILGGLLRSKGRFEEWENVLKDEIWTTGGVQGYMYRVLHLSYNELSPALRLCFSYCAIFPGDTKIIVESLIEKWMALGYLGSNVYDLELKGRECFNVLAMRSLFQDFEKDDSGEIISCKMHDLLHEFCQSIRKTNRLNKSIACQFCDPSQVFNVNAFFTLYCNEETPPNLCKCLVRLRILNFTNCGLKGIPNGIENMIHLRWLNLTGITEISSEELKIIFNLYRLQTLGLRQCGLKEIPMEIGNLIQLRRLDLSLNWALKELPEAIGKLIRLRYLNLQGNKSLEVSHDSICGLHELKTLNSLGCKSVCRFCIRNNMQGYSLGGYFHGIDEWCKLTSYKDFNGLLGVLWLRIRLNGVFDLEEVVEDVRAAAELTNETYIEELRIYVVESTSKSSVSMDVIEALRPHPNLGELSIWNCGGSKLPMWIISPVNQLRNLSFHFCNHLTSLPPLGKLQCLEEIHIDLMESLEIVGREFLGMTTGEGGAGDVVVFPKLKTLELRDCDKWTKWEDITEEEEGSAGFSVMPCLTELTITGCNGLTMLPHRLLRKASLLNKLRISGSTELVRRYGNEDDSIPINNPGLHLICYS